jgi:hypothetical protein
MRIERSGKPFDLAKFLARPLMAHLATASSDGPRESPVWFLWEDDDVWLVGTSSDSFPGRIRSEPRCALGFVDFALESGTLLHVGMRGRAVIVGLDNDRLYRLLRRYLGDDRSRWNHSFVETVINNLDLMVRFTPESAIMRDQSYFH